MTPTTNTSDPVSASVVLGTCENVSLYFLTASWKNFSRAVIPVFRNIKTKPFELNIGLKFMTEETSPIPNGGFWTIF